MNTVKPLSSLNTSTSMNTFLIQCSWLIHLFNCTAKLHMWIDFPTRHINQPPCHPIYPYCYSFSKVMLFGTIVFLDHINSNQTAIFLYNSTIGKHVWQHNQHSQNNINRWRTMRLQFPRFTSGLFLLSVCLTTIHFFSKYNSHTENHLFSFANQCFVRSDNQYLLHFLFHDFKLFFFK